MIALIIAVAIVLCGSFQIRPFRSVTWRAQNTMGGAPSMILESPALWLGGEDVLDDPKFYSLFGEPRYLSRTSKNKSRQVPRPRQFLN